MAAEHGLRGRRLDRRHPRLARRQRRATCSPPARPGLRAGAIVLAHDGHRPGRPRGPTRVRPLGLRRRWWPTTPTPTAWPWPRCDEQRVAGTTGSRPGADGLDDGAGADRRRRAPRATPSRAGPLPAPTRSRCCGHAGALRFNAVAGADRPAAALELELVRRVAAADGSVGRIFDGHLNARRADRRPGAGRAARPGAARGQRRRAVGRGLGRRSGPRRGTAGGVVTAKGAARCCAASRRSARAPAGCTGRWCWRAMTPIARRPAGRRCGSTSPIDRRRDRQQLVPLPRAGGLGLAPGRLPRRARARPARRARGDRRAALVRPRRAAHAASWAGMADTAVRGGARLARRASADAASWRGWPPGGSSPRSGRSTSGWRRPPRRWTGPTATWPAVALHGRVAIADACRTLLDEAARACGSRPFARGDALDRARRDLEVFLLQHRLDPMLARAGAAALGARPTS